MGPPTPYLLPATLLAAGLDGIERGLKPGPRSDANTYTDPPDPETARPLPTALADALEAFRHDARLREALGEPFCTAYEALVPERTDG